MRSTKIEKKVYNPIMHFNSFHQFCPNPKGSIVEIFHTSFKTEAKK